MMFSRFDRAATLAILAPDVNSPPRERAQFACAAPPPRLGWRRHEPRALDPSILVPLALAGGLGSRAFPNQSRPDPAAFVFSGLASRNFTGPGRPLKRRSVMVDFDVVTGPAPPLRLPCREPPVRDAPRGNATRAPTDPELDKSSPLPGKREG
jgi:hypothetical protein